jgi:hypothetical protein
MYAFEVQRCNDGVTSSSIAPIADPHSSTSATVIVYRSEALYCLWRVGSLDPPLNTRNGFFFRLSSYVTIVVLLNTNI